MRFLIALFLILNISLAHADEIRCYSDGKLIYHHRVYDINYYDGLFMFTEANTDRPVFAGADCIAKVNVN
jgi:hypothetical protein